MVDIRERVKTGIDGFDELINGGIPRGNLVVVTGSCGTGKTTFVLQSLYNALKNGETAIYISFEQSSDKIRKFMKRNYGWDFSKYEKKKKFAFLDLDPFVTARSVEASLAQKKGELLISVEGLDFPFAPDRIAVDSLSALAVAFLGNIENYRYYIRHLFLSLEQIGSVNYFVSETSDPDHYSPAGIEEFLADGVVLLYNKKIKNKRYRYMEILKMRWSDHAKKLIPFKIDKHGIKLSRK